MKDELKAKLDSVFQKREAKKQAAEAARQAAKSKADTFLSEFLKVRATVIQPAMEEVGQFAKAKGLDYDVSTQEEGRDLNNPSLPISAAIRLAFIPGKRTPRGMSEQPGLTVTCNKLDERVDFHESTMAPGRGGTAGSAGSVTLSEVTADLIQEKAVALITKLLS